MKTEITMHGKKISQKKAAELIGKEKLADRIKDATETFIDDPLMLCEWMDGLAIEIKF